MSIFAPRVIRRNRPKFFAGLTPRSLSSRPRPAHPFGEGLLPPPVLANTPVVLSVTPVANQPGKYVALMEDEFWHTREPARAYRYCVVQMHGETETGYTGTDSLGDAKTLIWHLTTPLPTLPDVYPDEAPELPESAYEPDEADRQWWAQHDHEQEGELSAWLSDAAPDDYAAPSPSMDLPNGQFGFSVEGGAW